MDENVNPRRSGRIWAGLFLVGIGAVLILDQMGFPLPDWLFNWPVLLIVIGLFIGIRHGFSGGAWLVLILVGTAFEYQNYYPQLELHRYIFPGILILIGIMFVLNPGRHMHYWGPGHDWRIHDKMWKQQWKQQWKQDWRQHRYGWRTGSDAYPPSGNTGGPNAPDPNKPSGAGPGGANDPGGAGDPGNPGGPTNSGGAPPGSARGPNSPGGPNSSGGPGTTTGSGPGPSGNVGGGGFSSGNYGSEDYLDTTTFFGGIHKKIVSKNFRGGDVTTIFGGTELDLSQADFTGKVRLDVTQVCGATKIIVPASWEVRTEVTAILAGFEDKRQQPTAYNPDKILILDGTSLMGGIELRNF